MHTLIRAYHYRKLFSSLLQRSSTSFFCLMPSQPRLFSSLLFASLQLSSLLFNSRLFSSILVCFLRFSSLLFASRLLSSLRTINCCSALSAAHTGSLGNSSSIARIMGIPDATDSLLSAFTYLQKTRCNHHTMVAWRMTQEECNMCKVGVRDT